MLRCYGLLNQRTSMNFSFIKIYVFLFCIGMHAQSQIKKLDFVNISDGESKVAVTSIIQDHYGFIWLGTAGVGINRFDGMNYVNYRHSLKDSTSINSSNIYCSYLDRKKRLWFGTEEGLNLYDRDLDQFIRVSINDSNNQDGSMELSIRSICDDGENNLFIGSFGEGLFKLDLDTFQTKKIAKPDEVNSTFLSISDIKCDAEGKVFVGTDVGLMEYDSTNEKLRFTKVNNSILAIDNSVTSLLIDHNDIWIGTESNGLVSLRDRGAELNGYIFNRYAISGKRIFEMIKASDDTILCGSENDGLIQVDKNGEVLNRYLYNKEDENSLLSNSIWSLFRDKDNRIWMGYYNSGVGIYLSLIHI